MTAIEVILNAAFGRPVTQADALEVLHGALEDHTDAARLDRVARIKARNEALRDAADELGSDTPGAWALAGLLETAIVRFESRTWPRLKAGLPCTLAPSERALYRAWLSGAHVPRTQRRLYDLLS